MGKKKAEENQENSAAFNENLRSRMESNISSYLFVNQYFMIYICFRIPKTHLYFSNTKFLDMKI
jgi:hypothetical protein